MQSGRPPYALTLLSSRRLCRPADVTSGIVFFAMLSQQVRTIMLRVQLVNVANLHSTGQATGMAQLNGCHASRPGALCHPSLHGLQHGLPLATSPQSFSKRRCRSGRSCSAPLAFGQLLLTVPSPPLNCERRCRSARSCSAPLAASSRACRTRPRPSSSSSSPVGWCAALLMGWSSTNGSLQAHQGAAREFAWWGMGLSVGAKCPSLVGHGPLCWERCSPLAPPLASGCCSLHTLTRSCLHCFVCSHRFVGCRHSAGIPLGGGLDRHAFT